MKIGKIINGDGYIIETVAYNEETNSIYMYELSENEFLIKEEIPNKLLNPKWNFEQNKWVENATKEELENKKQKELEKELEVKKQEEQEHLKQDLDKKLLQTISDLQMEVAMLKMKGGK